MKQFWVILIFLGSQIHRKEDLSVKHCAPDENTIQLL